MLFSGCGENEKIPDSDSNIPLNPKPAHSPEKTNFNAPSPHTLRAYFSSFEYNTLARKTDAFGLDFFRMHSTGIHAPVLFSPLALIGTLDTLKTAVDAPSRAKIDSFLAIPNANILLAELRLYTLPRQLLSANLILHPGDESALNPSVSATFRTYRNALFFPLEKSPEMAVRRANQTAKDMTGDYIPEVFKSTDAAKHPNALHIAHLFAFLRETQTPFTPMKHPIAFHTKTNEDTVKNIAGLTVSDTVLFAENETFSHLVFTLKKEGDEGGAVPQNRHALLYPVALEIELFLPRARLSPEALLQVLSINEINALRRARSQKRLLIELPSLQTFSHVDLIPFLKANTLDFLFTDSSPAFRPLLPQNTPCGVACCSQTLFFNVPMTFSQSSEGAPAATPIPRFCADYPFAFTVRFRMEGADNKNDLPVTLFWGIFTQ